MGRSQILGEKNPKIGEHLVGGLISGRFRKTDHTSVRFFLTSPRCRVVKFYWNRQNVICHRNLSGGVSSLPRRELQIEWKSSGDPKPHRKSYRSPDRCLGHRETQRKMFEVGTGDKRAISTPRQKAFLIFPQLVLDNEHREGSFKPRTKALRM